MWDKKSLSAKAGKPGRKRTVAAVTTAAVLAACVAMSLPASAQAQSGLLLVSPTAEQVLYERIHQYWRYRDMCTYVRLFMDSPRHREILDELIRREGTDRCNFTDATRPDRQLASLITGEDIY